MGDAVAMAQGQKNMKIRHSLFFYLASLSATPIVGGYNLYSNFESDLYAVEHDTIAIPFTAIIGTLFLSLLVLVLQRPYRLKKSSNMPRPLLAKLASVFATVVTTVLLLDNLIYWLHPNHLPTFLMFLTVSYFYMCYQLQLYGIKSTGSGH
ncbi:MULTISPECIES: hypothetical protein [unclassified Pseudomonas]|uniref:hypothetical protein n=1 Tax=unclassified Pseudomonas TaxID=196821 RepID=UPI0039B73E87